jgi:L-asparaginase/Glu-tRNA(Gln) amidotransferase subunit D
MQHAPTRTLTSSAMRLHIITTGGTIDKIYFDAKSDYQVGEPVIGELLDSMGVAFPFTVESAMRKDSLDMTDADRQLIRDLATLQRAEGAHHPRHGRHGHGTGSPEGHRRTRPSC